MINLISLSGLELSLHEAKNNLLLLIDKEAQKIFTTHGAFIAGGSLTMTMLKSYNADFRLKKPEAHISPENIEFEDIDIYFRTEKDLNNCWADLCASFEIKNRAKTKYAINIPHDRIAQKPVQLINCPTLFGDPYDIISLFDFTITQIAYDFKNNEIVFGSNFFLDLIRRKLVIVNQTLSPLSTFIRVEKYKHRGFTISLAEQLKLSLLIGKLQFETMKDALEEVKKSFYASASVFGQHIEQYKDIPYDANLLIKILSQISLLPQQYCAPHRTSDSLPF